MYTDLQVKIDDIAERILTLGHAPQHRYSKHQDSSAIEESQEVNDGMKTIDNILSSLKSILTLQRELLDLSGEIGDEGTNALMSDYIRHQEKLVWMYSAILKK